MAASDDRRELLELFNAAETGELKRLKNSVAKYGTDLSSIKDDTGRTLLMEAAEGGHEAIVLYLIEAFKGDLEEYVNDKDREGETALLKAVRQRHDHVAQLLLEKEANCNIPDIRGILPLQYAIENEHEYMGKILASKALLKGPAFELILKELERDGPFGCILLEACFEKVEREFGHAYVGSYPRTTMVSELEMEDLMPETPSCDVQPRPITPVLLQLAHNLSRRGGLDRILPRRRPLWDYIMLRNSTRSTPAVYRARVAGLCNMDVVHAFADAPTSALVLNSDPAEAIVNFIWEHFRSLFFIDMILDVVLLSEVILLSSERHGGGQANAGHFDLACVLVFVIFVRELLQMVSKMRYYVRRHSPSPREEGDESAPIPLEHAKKDESSVEEGGGNRCTWSQSACLAASGFMQYYFVDANIFDWWILGLHAWGLAAANGGEYTATSRLGMAAWVVICWINVLFDLKAFAAFATRMLPMIATLKDTVPFFIVTWGFLITSANAVYILETRDDGPPMSIYFPIQLAFRLVMLGDVDRFEVEGTDVVYREVPGTGTWEPEDPAPTPKLAGVTIWILLSTLAVHVGLMNLFIGILSTSYDKYEGQARCLFVQDRSRIIVRLDARWEFIFQAWKYFRAWLSGRIDDDVNQYLLYAVKAQTTFDDDRSLRTVIKKPVELLLAKQQSTLDSVQAMRRTLEDITQSLRPRPDQPQARDTPIPTTSAQV
mmetsp:Transcript_77255/g.213680  ORF Transcript_77255/g.213680 Transcript_77255/m.213680 type:complete len:718 (-) Transcript_77255:177-2330(-)